MLFELKESLLRTISGAVLSAGVSIASLRLRALTRSGAFAGAVVGTVAVTAGWSWGLVLISFFLSATLLAHVGATRKERVVASLIAKHGPRDAMQVLANGGVFLVAAFGASISESRSWIVIGIGALAAAAADTWATEVGTLSRGRPRSIVSGMQVPAGTSGGVTLLGTLAAIAGASFMALIAWLVGWTIPFPAVVVAGVGGSTLDSLLGATVQERRWCDACGEATERDIHRCGARTRRLAGIPRFDNDVVNLACSAAGASIALVLS